MTCVLDGCATVLVPAKRLRSTYGDTAISADRSLDKRCRIRQSARVTDESWTPMNLTSDYDRYWSQIDRAFDFRPSLSPLVRPGIVEPKDSVTFSLAPIFAGPDSTFAESEAAINSEVLRALVAVVPPEEELVALDWQHQGCWFRPHLFAVAEAPWPVPPFPNGDYYFLLTSDYSTGTFGHPWEQSLCIIGTELIDELAPMLHAWLPVLREGGA